MTTARAFVAVEIPERLRTAIADTVASARPLLPPARWVRRENYHLTLCFLGELEVAQQNEIEHRLAVTVAGRQPFELRLGYGGAFPANRPARVVWLGFGVVEELDLLQADVARCCREVVDRQERRPFHAHLTLARCRQPWQKRAVERVARALSPLAGRPVPIDRAFLMNSRLAPGGASYETVASFPFEAAS